MEIQCQLVWKENIKLPDSKDKPVTLIEIGDSFFNIAYMHSLIKKDDGWILSIHDVSVKSKKIQAEHAERVLAAANVILLEEAWSKVKVSITTSTFGDLLKDVYGDFFYLSDSRIKDLLQEFKVSDTETVLFYLNMVHGKFVTRNDVLEALDKWKQ